MLKFLLGAGLYVLGIWLMPDVVEYTIVGLGLVVAGLYLIVR